MFDNERAQYINPLITINNERMSYINLLIIKGR